MVFRDDLSDVQQLVLALMPIPTGLLSLVASSTIILLVCRSKRSSSYRRILIGLSISDILVITGMLTGPLLVPHESSDITRSMNFDDRNNATCSLNGVLLQTALWSNSLYSSFLAVYFLFTVRLGWSPSRFARVLEPWIHLFIIAIGILFGAISLGLNTFTKARTSSSCWIDSREFIYYCVLFNIIVGLAFSCILACNLSIYLYVRSLTRSSLRRSMTPSVATNRTYLVATQSFCYVAAFAVTWAPGMLMGTHDLSGGILFRSTAAYFVFDALMVVLTPLTGFLNLMVFLRPRYLQFRKQQPDATKWQCVQFSLSKAFQSPKRRSTKLRACDRVQVQKQGDLENDIAVAEISSELLEETNQDSTNAV